MLEVFCDFFFVISSYVINYLFDEMLFVGLYGRYWFFFDEIY